MSTHRDCDDIPERLILLDLRRWHCQCADSVTNTQTILELLRHNPPSTSLSVSLCTSPTMATMNGLKTRMYLLPDCRSRRDSSPENMRMVALFVNGPTATFMVSFFVSDALRTRG